MQPLVTTSRFFPTSCSNYVPKSVASCLNCTSRTQKCPALSWCSMCFSCHIQTYIHPTCHSSRSTWKADCCSFSLVIVKEYCLQVIRSYALDFSFGYFKGDFIRGITYLLLKHAKHLYDSCQKRHKYAINTMRKSEQTNLNELIQYILQITSNLSHIFCASRPSDSSMCFFRPFLHKLFSNSQLGSETWAVT